MFKWMKRYLRRHSLQQHFLYAVCIGLVLRLLSAYFVYGPQALDDYKHGVWPAYQFFAGLPLDIPDYRSHLLIWFLSSFAHVASWFGADSALAQVRAMYMGLGLFSLLGILGTYLYAQTVRSRVYGPLIIYVVAMFPLMPFVSTRAFGEAIAVNLVLLAFGLLEWARCFRKDSMAWWSLGFMALGLATMFRFHVGIIYVALITIYLFERQMQAVLGALISGVWTLVATGMVDILSGKAPLGTLFIYLAENQGGGAKYGVSPWYNPWLFVLALTLPPFSFLIFKHVKTIWRRQWRILVPLLLFIAAHSIAAHKEERFLYPILGLELWAVGMLWCCGSLRPAVRRFYAAPFMFVTALLLPVVCFVNSQEGEIEPPALVERQFKEVVYLDYKSLFGQSRFQFYFLREPSRLEPVEREELTPQRVDQAFAEHPTAQAVAVLSSEASAFPLIGELSELKTRFGKCGSPKQSGSLVDKLLFKLNPNRNQRRRPTWFVICERGS